MATTPNSAQASSGGRTARKGQQSQGLITPISMSDGGQEEVEETENEEEEEVKSARGRKRKGEQSVVAVGCFSK